MSHTSINEFVISFPEKKHRKTWEETGSGLLRWNMRGNTTVWGGWGRAEMQAMEPVWGWAFSHADPHLRLFPLWPGQPSRHSSQLSALLPDLCTTGGPTSQGFLISLAISSVMRKGSLKDISGDFDNPYKFWLRKCLLRFLAMHISIWFHMVSVSLLTLQVH